MILLINYQFESHDFLKEMTIQTVHIYGKPIHTVNGENKRTMKKKTALMCMIKF